MPFLTNEMMRSIIMDHYSNPTHKHQPTGEGYTKIHMHSDNCIDDMDIFVLIENGIVKDATIVSELVDEIEEVVDKWNTTIGTVFIKKKLNEIRARYGIIEGEQKHTSHIANQIYNELRIHAY